MKNLALINNINNPSQRLSDNQQQQLGQLIDQLDTQQCLWLSGYLAARAEIHDGPSKPTQANKSDQKFSTQAKLTILFGSQTGNGESIAQNLQQHATSTGISTELFSLADFKVKQLSQKHLVTLIISTHGEGEAPDDAELFHEQLFSHKAPNLSHLKFNVLALGDSSYEKFCQTGLEIDQRLAELGAQQIHPRVDCDVDFEETASAWVEDLLSELKQQIDADEYSNNITTLPLQTNNQQPTDLLIDKHNPYHAEILTVQKITARDSSKNTFHLELEIDPELIQYQPGDSLGIVANNDPNTVQLLLDFWQLTGTELFSFKDQTVSLSELLTKHVEITQLSKPFIQFLASKITSIELNEMASSHSQFESYCHDHQLIDLLQKFDPKQQISAQEILNQLKGKTPRLYSIASAQSVSADEVHLTINLDAATTNGFYGLASGLLCKRLVVGDEVAVYVEPNPHFRLPDQPSTPIIMIGPGTGVAPFRAFLQQRQAAADGGENWLFFGNPNFSSDFLYQAEWLKLQKTGLLNQISVAFSRDQAEKIYVQDKLKENAIQVWDWLDQGAYIYLCGDANNMAKDVETTLIGIITEQGQLSTNKAQDFLKNLKRNNRYQKDVY